MAKRVLMAMSGGIDSTVAAILLQEQGFELVGVTFRTFDKADDSASDKGCCSIESIREAQNMARTLGFEHHILDFRSTFRQHVIKNFVDEYSRGRTPNPCVHCNSHIKWGKLVDAANEFGCDLIATGHYAQIAEFWGHFYLKTAVDTHKDQTYFLWMLTEENLKRTLFPLGGFTKTEVRQIALNHGFESLSKKSESQEICFVPNNDYRTFLTEQLREQGMDISTFKGFSEGDYLSPEGAVIGKHSGFCNYTIGQRKGLRIAFGSPRYVTKINAEQNQVTLGLNDDLFAQNILAQQIRLRDANWLQNSPKVDARIRYKSPAVPATLDLSKISDDILNVVTHKPVWGVTPGQSLVLYKNGLVVGGGIIER